MRVKRDCGAKKKSSQKREIWQINACHTTPHQGRRVNLHLTFFSSRSTQVHQSKVANSRDTQNDCTSKVYTYICMYAQGIRFVSPTPLLNFEV